MLSVYLGRNPRVQELLRPGQEPWGWPRQEAGCEDAPAQLHAARQSKSHLVPACLCTHTLNNPGCFPEQVSRLHYIFTCLARDRASALINEEKGLLALQEIYVTVSLSLSPRNPVCCSSQLSSLDSCRQGALDLGSADEHTITAPVLKPAAFTSWVWVLLKDTLCWFVPNQLGDLS